MAVIKFTKKLYMHTKAIFFVSALIILVFGGFGLWILSESDSVSVGWQKFLPWLAAACWALFIFLIFWFGKSNKKW